MKFKISIFYSWFIRTTLYFLPNLTIIMRFRGFLYSLMMKKCGKNFQVASNVYINNLSNLEIGDNVYLAPNIVIIAKYLYVGSNVLIGPNTVISGGNHIFSNESFRFAPSKQSNVIIEEGSWVGANCSIIAGSLLPKKSVLAAGSVLNKKFHESYSIFGGVPAKFIKKHIEN